MPYTALNNVNLEGLRSWNLELLEQDHVQDV